MEHLNSQVLKGILFLKVIFNPISFSQLNPVFFPLDEEISCFKWIKQWKLRFRRFCYISSSSTAAQIWCRTWMSASHLLVLFSFFPVTGGKRNPRKADIVGANFLSFSFFIIVLVCRRRSHRYQAGYCGCPLNGLHSFRQAAPPPSNYFKYILFYYTIKYKTITKHFIFTKCTKVLRLYYIYQL